MTERLVRLIALATLVAATALPATIYSNTTTDTLDTIFFSTGPYDELGDQIHLAGTERQTTGATVQFFNNGVLGTFDAILRFYVVGSPVAAQIGSNYTVTGITAPAGGVFNVTFSGLSTVVPDDVIFTIALANATSNTDIGLDMFEPPTVGTSDPKFYIGKQGSTYSQLLTPKDEDVFFQLDAIAVVASVPEPGTLGLLGCGIAAVLIARKKRRIA